MSAPAAITAATSSPSARSLPTGCSVRFGTWCRHRWKFLLDSPGAALKRRSSRPCQSAHFRVECRMVARKNTRSRSPPDAIHPGAVRRAETPASSSPIPSTIRNNGSLPVQLISRHWIITDGPQPGAGSAGFGRSRRSAAAQTRGKFRVHERQPRSRRRSGRCEAATRWWPKTALSSTHRFRVHAVGTRVLH